MMPDPVCPTDCSATLPPLSFDDCNPEINDAQIDRIFFTNVGNPLVDWTNATEWNGRLSQTGTNGDAIRELCVIGEKPRPTSNKRDISKGRKVIGKKDHVLNFRIDDTSQDNHDAIRQLECGGNILFWYTTLGGLMYGGTEGIEAQITMDNVIVEDDNEIIEIQGELEWTRKFTEERIPSPI